MRDIIVVPFEVAASIIVFNHSPFSEFIIIITYQIAYVTPPALLLPQLPTVEACKYEYPYMVWICMEPEDYDDDDLSKTRKELFPARHFLPREVTVKRQGFIHFE